MLGQRHRATAPLSARLLAIGLTTGLLATFVAVPTASAAVEFKDPPTRLYMLPNAPGPLPAPIPFPLVPDGVLLFDGSTDLISQDDRTIEIESEEPACDFGPTYALTGCTAVQLDVSHGQLDFTTAPTRIEYDTDPSDDDDTLDGVVYQLPGGSLVRDMDSDDDLPASAPALIGKTSELNADLQLLRYTPTADYYYDGSNPETLSVDIVPGSGSGSVTHDIQLRVLDLNDFPEMTVPSTLYTADPGQEIVLGPDSAWEVTDEDNDEPDGDDTLDGVGEEFILIAWASCGYFKFQGASGMTLRDDLEEVLDYALDLASMDPGTSSVIKDAFFAILPDEIESMPFATGNPNEYAQAFAGVVDDIEWLNYHLDEITFAAVTDPVTMTPLSDDLCDIRFLVTDIGNNGLPLQYIGDPPEGVEVPFFGFDIDTNDFPGVELVQVQVGDGKEIEVQLGDVTLPEDTTSTLTVTITPATHPAFDLTVSTSPNGATTPDVDYTTFTAQTVSIPADAGSVTISVDALLDGVYDPGETYTVTATGPASPPPGYQITLTDPAGLVTITDIDPPPDATPPTVTINQAGGQADPTSASPIVFTVVFSEPVTGFTDPTTDLDLTASTAGGPLAATIIPVSTTEYTVEVTGMSADGDVIATIPAGAAADGATNPSTASTSSDNTVTYELPDVDQTPPTVTINQSGTQADPTSASPIVFTVMFSESVTGFDDPTTDVDLSASTAGGPLAATIVPVSTTEYTVEVTGMSADGDVIATIPAGAAADAATNPSTASTSTDNTVTYELPEVDETPPTVTINQAGGQIDPTGASPIVFTVVFSEPVTGFDAPTTDLDLTASTAGGPLAATIIPVSTTEYTVEVTGMSADGDVIATIPAGAAADAATNPSTASTSTDNTVTYELPEVDETPPTVTINQAGGQIDPTSASPIVFTVVFSEPVTGFTDPTADLDLTASTAGGPLAATIIPVSTTEYTVEVTGMSADGDVIATIPAGAAADAATNPSTASTSTDNTVTYELPEVDETPPTVTINQAGGQTDPTSASPIVFTVVFSEPVTGFDDPTTDVDLSASTAGGPLAATIVPVSTTEYTVEVTGMSADGDVIATIPAGAAADGATNPSTASTSSDNTVTYELPAAPLTIQVPADIVVYADPGDSGIAVDYPAATTTGGVSPVSVVCDQASGDVYPLGVTTVSCTATDAAQQTATDSFTITVLESDEPDDGDDGDGDDDLPNTGADPSAPLAAAALLLLLGGSLRLLVRRLQA